MARARCRPTASRSRETYSRPISCSARPPRQPVPAAKRERRLWPRARLADRVVSLEIPSPLYTRRAMNLVGTALERDHAASRAADFCRRPGGLDRFNGAAQLGLVPSQYVGPANRRAAANAIKD